MSASVTPIDKKSHHRHAPVKIAAAVPPIDTKAIIESLRASAATILQPVLGTSSLQGFQVGSLGNFPYYWQNPTNLDFNHLTYRWIDSNLAANTTPVAQDGLFTNEYIQVLSAVQYNLSKADQAKLAAAAANVTNEQAALLNAWAAQFGSIPPASGGLQPIDLVMNTIKTTWAQPPTTLMAMQNARNLGTLLSNAPASAGPILPVLAAYLNAYGAAISISDAEGTNRGALAAALAAVQTPSSITGGQTTDDGQMRPAYQVSTPLSSILNGLSATSNAVTLGMSVQRSSASEYTIQMAGQASFSVPVDDFFTADVSVSANYFKDSIATSSNQVTVSMTFDGVTLVNFGPVAFDLVTYQNWFWMDPIRQAIANGQQDVTGFEFGSDPHVDFSASGPFGFMTGVAIANYPSVQITVVSSDYESINETFSTHTDVSVSFLGIPLASGSASTYSANSSVDASTQTVTITLDPPQQLIAGNQTDSRGWILGVQTDYPAKN